MAVTHFAAIILIVTFFGNSSEGYSNKIQTVVGRITQRSTGRQKQARFLPIGNLLAKERYHSKRNFFFAFAACELSRYSH
jgi:hypothetical protein